jgi:putative membrane protein
MFWYGGNWMWWQAALGWVGLIVLLGLLIWGIYALVRSTARRPGDGEQGSNAGRILDERLARGEIDAEEYRRLRDLIESGRGAGTARSGTRS